ncbi:hypothetical protein SADUNF_Sadunf18G0012200 [Salix dunnii]|uniref:Uncharacterized protein n=1 Tax=Salix dunnii TaxID=1413687 RepID=A0A835MFV7_9ROSI|nr:hypothetical protein SADUNF_Sadunf18G0012200 [Salix dunnii]
MVVYLPMALVKDWLCSLFLSGFSKNLYNGNFVIGSFFGLNIPFGVNDMHDDLESDLRVFIKFSLREYKCCKHHRFDFYFGVFHPFLGALLGQETINFGKVVAVFITMAGVAMITVGKTWAPEEMSSFSGFLKLSFDYIVYVSRTRRHSIIGDIFGLFSAISYNLFAGPSVVWTTPFIATLGMSLTIPLAMLADMVIHGHHYSAIYILGCIQVHLFSSSCKFILFLLSI